ncbi:hypothetical protein CAT7_06031 [Carnobacterium sp. AT7]|uniref:phage integrase N-terminal SAM-like domain-containing protein n=1 Tax=Carnobacterium sp. AT7 TaxID=333990 RepID=UPI00015F1D3E|nr:phage integrase N-terminal SAM-like domain-containing protein [Carnobacterium sp. AT7]EDP69056.1 hypothetical protein CAT7_06031 [Carnobacterium sp. AT7]
MNNSNYSCEAKKEIINQMEVKGPRERTVKEYIKWFDEFTFFTGATYVHQFTKSDIYDWLQDMDVSDNTCQIRLKALKALLNRMYENNWIEDKFWKNLRIKIAQSQKAGTTPEQFQQLLNVLDLTSFFDLRLATGALIMYKAAKDYQIKNINPHSLRRGFAMNLRSQRADVVFISKASVRTQVFRGYNAVFGH